MGPNENLVRVFADCVPVWTHEGTKSIYEYTNMRKISWWSEYNAREEWIRMEFNESWSETAFAMDNEADIKIMVNRLKVFNLLLCITRILV